jgi:hypothetical protein
VTNVKFPLLRLGALTLQPHLLLVLGGAVLEYRPAWATPQSAPLDRLGAVSGDVRETAAAWRTIAAPQSLPPLPPPLSLSSKPQPVPAATALRQLLPVSDSPVSDSSVDWTVQSPTASTLGPPLAELSSLTADPTDYLPSPRRATPVLQAETVEPTPAIADPDLGILRLRRSPSTQTGDAPNAQPLPQPSCDPELGCLRLRDSLPPQATTAAPRAPVVYVIARTDYFHNSNLFSDQTPVPDGLTRPGLTLYTSPMLGPNTYAVASVTGNLLRYSTQSRLNSNELFLRAGILQRLSSNMFGEIGWSHQQLFVASDKLIGYPVGSRFFNEHAIRLELSRRDQLAKNLSLNSFYQFRCSFADPIDRSRITNALTLSLNYDLKPNLQLGLDYQLGLASFTQQKRHDRYHQVLGRLTYTPVKNTQVSAFIGYGFGNSSDPSVRFNSLLVGVSVNLTLGLF